MHLPARPRMTATPGNTVLFTTSPVRSSTPLPGALPRLAAAPGRRVLALPRSRTRAPLAVMRVLQAVLVSAAAAVPTVEIAPGVHMPMISLGTGQTRCTPLPTPCHTAQHPHGAPLRYLAVQLVARRECGEPRAQAWLHAHRHRQRLQEPRRRRPRTGASHHCSRSDRRNATLLALALALALNRLRTRPPTRP